MEEGGAVRLQRHVVEELMVRPGRPAQLAARSTSETRADWLGPLGRASAKQVAEHDLETFRSELERAQELLYADSSWAVLIVLQALDAAGKDGTIKHVMSGVNPQGCEVVAFKQPSAEELGHDFLWRCARALPERGRIGIFNRSYYEEVLVTRVHPDLVAAEHLPAAPEPGRRLWQERYDDINAFERHLARSGVRLVKLFLHISKETQRRRFLERLDDPAKHWKFSPADLAERAHFEVYQEAYEEAITATSTPWAPWYVVPADHKFALRALVGGVVVSAIDTLDLHPPSLSEDQERALAGARRALEDERAGPPGRGERPWGGPERPGRPGRTGGRRRVWPCSGSLCLPARWRPRIAVRRLPARIDGRPDRTERVWWNRVARPRGTSAAAMRLSVLRLLPSRHRLPACRVALHAARVGARVQETVISDHSADPAQRPWAGHRDVMFPIAQRADHLLRRPFLHGQGPRLRPSRIERGR